MFSLTQKSLVKKRLRLRDVVLSRATLFPMFFDSGKVEALLVVDHEGGKVYWTPWSKGLIHKPWFRPLRVARTLSNLEELTVEKAYQLTRYWHYDPWWLSTEAPFGDLPTTPPLRVTNCADHWSGLAGLYFSRDLGKVDFLSEPQGDGVAIKSVKDRPLPAREEIDPPRELIELGEGSQRGGWRLRPFWQRPA